MWTLWLLVGLLGCATAQSESSPPWVRNQATFFGDTAPTPLPIPRCDEEGVDPSLCLPVEEETPESDDSTTSLGDTAIVECADGGDPEDNETCRTIVVCSEDPAHPLCAPPPLRIGPVPRDRVRSLREPCTTLGLSVQIRIDGTLGVRAGRSRQGVHDLRQGRQREIGGL